MNASMRIDETVENLAASWTDVVLETLSAVGFGQLNVERELEVWRALKTLLRDELRWQRAFRSSMLVAMNDVMERVLWKAAIWVAKQWSSRPVTPELATSLRRAVATQPVTWADRHLFAEIVREPSVPAVFQAPLRTDFVARPRLAVAR